MSDLFVSLEAVILEGESLTFKISRQGAHLVVLLIPSLQPALTSLTPEVEKARTALSLPLRLEMTPAQLDAELIERIHGYGAVRSELREGYDLIVDELKKAKQEAQQAAAALRAKRKGDAAVKPASTATTPAPSKATGPNTASGTATPLPPGPSANPIPNQASMF